MGCFIDEFKFVLKCSTKEVKLEVFGNEVKFVLSLCSTKEVKWGVFIDEVKFVLSLC